MKKFLSFLLVLLMVLSLTACGGGGDNGGNSGGDGQNENVYTLGDFQIEYKGAEIAPDDDGFTSVIITLGFTNNSKSAARYGFSMYQKAEQAGEFMLAAALNSVSDEGYMKEIEPGETVDVITGFVLNAVDYQGNPNYTDEIKMSIEDADSGKSCTITIDTAGLAAGDGGSGGADDSGTDDSTGVAWLDYWVGDWFGWWYMTDGTGSYAEYSDTVWDACARIEAYETMQGLMELWDSDGSSDNLIAAIDLGFANPDDTDYGVMSCEGGQFLSMMLESGDWFVDPSQLAYDNIFDFSGEYVDEYGTFSYRVLLRPWGIMWDDLDEGYYPDCYEDWYLPLVRSGAAMPDSIG